MAGRRGRSSTKPRQRPVAKRDRFMDTLTNIRAFLATAETRSFSAAARQLGVMPSVVMKRVKQLENELKCRLFERSTRRLALTEAGESSLAGLKDVLEKFQRVRQQ